MLQQREKKLDANDKKKKKGEGSGVEKRKTFGGERSPKGQKTEKGHLRGNGQ